MRSNHQSFPVMSCRADFIPFDDNELLEPRNAWADNFDEEGLVPPHYGSPLGIDYWFGKKWFECFVAQQLIYVELAKDSILDMDVRRSCPSGMLEILTVLTAVFIRSYNS